MVKAAKNKIKVTLIRSPVHRKVDQKRTVIGLGLGKLHSTSELEDTPAIRGMINKVKHLVRVD